ncbi:hypothetical protein CRUP_013482, partial [Coryphaenoides rupestris]
ASASVTIPKEHHRFVIGKNGEKLQELELRTATKIAVPRPDGPGASIRITGTKEGIEKARHEVLLISAEQGLTDGEERISLEGPTEEVEQAQTQIQEIIKDLLVRMDYTEVIIEQRFHRHLIGKNGTNINRIKEQYKVSVRIPQDCERSGLVRIEGDPKGVQLARRELLEMVQRMKYHRTVIGQKGEKIKEVRDKFPEVIINFPDPAQKSDTVQLRGPKNEVEKCAKFLQKMIAELIENSFSLSVPIFKQFHKNIIGKGGANIKKIREETNTKIDLPTENSNSEMIVITGRKNHCEAARERILAIQRDLANIKEMEVTIPAKLHNSLIGSKGCLVRAVMEECGGGVHIHFPSEGSGSDRVTIRGPASEVERARRQLLQLAQEKQVNNFTAELQAKPEYHRFLIGKGGANIRRDDVVEDSMVVDARHHRHFVCRRGQVLRELAEEYGGVAVSFPRTGAHGQRVTLKGAKDCVEAAKRRIQEIVDDLESQVSVEVCVPQRYHRAVMGPKGCRENGEASPDGEVVAPPLPRKCDIITISGRAEKCELAKAALLALVPVTEDVEVSYELHRYINRPEGQRPSGR